jgi:membrane-bound lytic murein transglycosylase B
VTQTRRTILAMIAAAFAAPALAQNEFPFVRDAGFDRWVAKFRPRAAKKGISAATFDAAFAEAGFIPAVIEKDRSQFEFNLSLEDYLAITASADRIKMGRAVMQRHGRLLKEIEQTYGVDAHVVAAVWGIESFYGTKRGTVPTIAALATLAYEGRRATFFEGQLLAALKILQNGDVTVRNMTGGWAGAMGHTQFIPTTYAAYAVDFRGDGRRDIWSDDPTDALASAANYLARSGWSYGQPWGVEVQLPPDFNRALAGNLRRRSTAEWSKYGVRAADGRRLADHGSGGIILPDRGGPAFLVFRNYSVITHYNAAQKYVIGLGHLSDRIKGAGPLVTPFARDEFGLSQAERVDMQKRLTRMGYDCGSVDGVFGPMTRAAIRGFQTSRGLKVDGIPSKALLAMMR